MFVALGIKLNSYICSFYLYEIYILFCVAILVLKSPHHFSTHPIIHCGLSHLCKHTHCPRMVQFTICVEILIFEPIF